ESSACCRESCHVSRLASVGTSTTTPISRYQPQCDLRMASPPPNCVVAPLGLVNLIIASRRQGSKFYLPAHSREDAEARHNSFAWSVLCREWSGQLVPLDNIQPELIQRCSLDILQRLVELVGHTLPVRGTEQQVVPINPVGRAERQVLNWT